MNKLIYAGALLVAFGAASAGTTRAKDKIEIVYQAQENGDYRLFIFGSNRSLVCEEHPIQIASQGDAINPVVIECNHSRRISENSDHWQPQ